jgi:hypothetical protein
MKLEFAEFLCKIRRELSFFCVTASFVSLSTILLIAASNSSGSCCEMRVQSSELGTVQDYSDDDWDLNRVHKVPSLGIEVREGWGELSNGRQVRGVEIYRVLPNSTSVASSLRDRRTSVDVAIVTLSIAGGLFPPAALVGALLVRASGIDLAQNLIMGVDGQRTRNINEFEAALSEAQEGEAIYLTMVSEGKRQQLFVRLPQTRK